jgi:hypothetical protein
LDDSSLWQVDTKSASIVIRQNLQTRVLKTQKFLNRHLASHCLIKTGALGLVLFWVFFFFFFFGVFFVCLVFCLGFLVFRDRVSLCSPGCP